jgi:hypothetical protein
MPDVTSDAERGDIEARFRAALEKDRRHAEQLRRDARAAFRVLEGWQRIGSQEKWVKVCEESQEEYQSGQFLLERLGARRSCGLAREAAEARPVRMADRRGA